MKEEYKALGSYGTLGLEIVLSILFGYFAGHWIDGKLGSDPWGGVIGFGFGCAAAVKAVLRSVKEMKKVAEREEREQGNPAPLYDKREDEGDERGDERGDAGEERGDGRS